MGTVSKLMKFINNEKGIAAVYIALLLFALVAFVALAIDIGYMYVAKGQLQNASDAAALAGAARLPKLPAVTSISAFGNLSGARREAWRFAYNNKMVPSGKSVFLIMSTSYNSLSGNLNDNNDNDGDIIVGHWDQSTGFARATASTTKRINAVKVVARRTSKQAVTNTSIGNNPVSTFFGNVLNMNNMSVSAQAIAAYLPGTTNYILMCSTYTKIPLPATPKGLDCNASSTYPNILSISPRVLSRAPGAAPEESFAWTNLSDANTNDTAVEDLICSKPANNDICNEQIDTTQGTGANLFSDMESAMYNQSYDTANKECVDKSGIPIKPCKGTKDETVTAWWVVIPVETIECDPQWQFLIKKYTIDHFALLRLISVCGPGGQKGCNNNFNAPSCPYGNKVIVYDRYSCMDCAQKELFQGLKMKLVH